MKYRSALKSKCLEGNSTNTQTNDAYALERMIIEAALNHFTRMDNIGMILSLLESVEGRLRRQTDELRQIRTELRNIEVHLEAARDEPLMMLAARRARAIHKTRKRKSIVERMMGIGVDASDNEMDVEIVLAGVQKFKAKNRQYKKIVGCSSNKYN